MGFANWGIANWGIANLKSFIKVKNGREGASVVPAGTCLFMTGYEEILLLKNKIQGPFGTIRSKIN